MIFFIYGILTGTVLSIILLFFLSPKIILREGKSKYSFEESEARVEKAVTGKGWKIPAKHDLQATLLKFGKAEVNKVVIYEICNPDLAEKILLTDNERIVSNLMPCRIAIYEKNDGNVYFSRMNSGLLSKAMGKVTKKQMSVAASDTEKFLNELI